MINGYEVVDAHCHVWPAKLIPRISGFLSNYYKVPWNEGGTDAHCVRSMEKYGIDKSVVFSVATKSAQVENINDFISKLPRDVFIPFGAMHQDYENYKNEIKRIKALGLKGIKFHPDFQNVAIDDIRMMRIYDEVGDTLPMLFHLGDENSDLSSPERMANVLREMPHLRIIGAHFGGYQQWEEAMEILAQFKQMYFETSSSIRFIGSEKATQLVKAYGVERICFGTDYPMINQRDEFNLFMEMGLNEEERKQILAENILRFIG
ncbi:MAG: amidohydrolase family protein [Eubacteriales bacterium]|nr:amidohydrolase family protein [Eubacteriales bacterium]